MMLTLLWDLGRVDDRPIRLDNGPRIELRLVHVRRPHDVKHVLSRREEVVSDEAPMATPPHRFGAHDRAAVLGAPPPQLR